MNPIIEKIEKEFDEKWKITCDAHEDGYTMPGCICYELTDLNSQNEDIKSFYRQKITELLEEIIKLSDEIELSAGHTELEEWRAFKRFRNTLRDKYEPNH